MGRVGNSPRVIVSGVFGGNKISFAMSLSVSPAMVSGISWGDNCQEKGYASILVNMFTGVDYRLFLLIDIALIIG